MDSLIFVKEGGNAKVCQEDRRGRCGDPEESGPLAAHGIASRMDGIRGF
jgi:hypothetical protein